MPTIQNRDRCTCGPFPSIDLTHTLSPSSDTNRSSLAKSFMEDACQSHGCFYLTTDTDFISSLADRKSPESDDNVLRALFSFNSTSSAKYSIMEHLFNEVNDTSGTTDDMTKIDTCGTSYRRRIRRSSALYRGRNSESGAPSGIECEPKQSWEWQRCSSLRSRHGTTNDEDEDEDENDEDSIDITLHKWTNALHKVACQVCEVLGLPEGFVVTKPCQCPCNEEEEAKAAAGSDVVPFHRPPCNVDLLRVFRYDPMKGSPDKQQPVLGSSPHTDWGTMTIVWQDDVGGLQMYCYCHSRWNDVLPPARTPFSESTRKEDNNKVHFFVHVGDFLSLAKTASETWNSANESLSVSGPSWISPRHRVLSPTALKPRFSLVYFLYPQPGLTLGQAEQYLRASIGRDAEIPPSCLDPSILQRYAVLQDQSKIFVKDAEAESVRREGAARAYAEMCTEPFDEIVSKKWAQVQRVDTALEL